IAALGGATHWEDYLLFRQAVPFGQTDPLFGNDLGFYVFTLPFLTYLQEWMVGLLLFTTVGAGALYFLTHGIVIGPRTVHVERQARLHLGLLATVLIGVKAWGYQLDTYDLLYSRRGVVFGAVYADIHAALPIFQGLLVLCSLTALACLLFALRATCRPAVLLGSLTFAVGAVSCSLCPDVLRRF